MLHLISCGETLYGRAVDVWSHVRILLRVLCWQTFIVVCRQRKQTHIHLHSNLKPFHSGKLGLKNYCLTFSIDDLIDFMRVVRILGIILYHLKAHEEVVQSASEVGFPPGLVIGKLVDFTTCYCPCLSTIQREA